VARTGPEQIICLERDVDPDPSELLEAMTHRVSVRSNNNNNNEEPLSPGKPAGSMLPPGLVMVGQQPVFERFPPCTL
jgi:hypothetical protein